MAKWAANHNGLCFRYGRGKNKFWQSWDAEKMAERERARRQKASTDHTDCHGLNQCESVKSVDKKKGGVA